MGGHRPSATHVLKTIKAKLGKGEEKEVMQEGSPMSDLLFPPLDGWCFSRTAWAHCTCDWELRGPMHVDNRPVYWPCGGVNSLIKTGCHQQISRHWHNNPP